MVLVVNDCIYMGNYCMVCDVVLVGDYCIFGYNVYIGLCLGIEFFDVFSVYQFIDQCFKEGSMKMLQDEKFLIDFCNFYCYYKDVFFVCFVCWGSYLYMVFYFNE